MEDKKLANNEQVQKNDNQVYRVQNQIITSVEMRSYEIHIYAYANSLIRDMVDCL